MPKDQDQTRVINPGKTTMLRPGGTSPSREILDACIVVIYGGELGKRYPITDEITVGRDRTNNIVLDKDNVSRHHARFSVGASGYVVEDLGSTNGTQVDDQEVRGTHLLRNGEQIKVGSVIFKFITGGNVELLFHEEIYQMTINDGLTQIHNKRYFIDFLDREVARASRRPGDLPLSLILFDIDHFKKLNDTFGHLAGDYVLRKVAEIIKEHVRREQLFARYGGEEFAIVLPDTDKARAGVFAEKCRAIVEGMIFSFDGESIRCTISFGVAELPDGCHESDPFIKRADECLYKAKAAGRNRVIIDGD